MKGKENRWGLFLKVPLKHMPRGTEETHINPLPTEIISRLRFQQETYR